MKIKGLEDKAFQTKFNRTYIPLIYLFKIKKTTNPPKQNFKNKFYENFIYL